jgi:hypothetical protein
VRFRPPCERPFPLASWKVPCVLVAFPIGAYQPAPLRWAFQLETVPPRLSSLSGSDLARLAVVQQRRSELCVRARVSPTSRRPAASARDRD